jgi:hypothetical protein
VALSLLIILALLLECHEDLARPILLVVFSAQYLYS